MEKKASTMLMEETLQTIIAVICILVLAYFLISVYNSRVKDAKLEQAKSVLTDSGQSIKKIINNLDNGDSFILKIVEPKSWSLWGFKYIEKPAMCDYENCLCICDNAFLGNQIKRCDKSGVCIIEDIAEDFEIKIDKDGITSVNISKADDKIYLEEIM